MLLTTVTFVQIGMFNLEVKVDGQYHLYLDASFLVILALYREIVIA